MNATLVTIGLTAFNAIDTVERAVRSALAQSWRPLEIVAVDDASTDGTRECLDALALRHPELRVFVNAENDGVAASRNRILAEARGEFVAFFDDDDVSEPDRVAGQVMRILAYERDFAAGAPVICHVARHQRYPDGSERTDPTMGQAENRPAPRGVAVAERILLGKPLENGNGACPTCSQMARLSVYRMLGGFDPSLRRAEDTDFNIRLALAGGHFVGIARPLVRQTMTRSSEKGLDEDVRYLLLLAEKHRLFIDRYGQYDFCRRWILMRHAWLRRQFPRFAGALLLLMLRHPVLSFRRLTAALPNIDYNRAISRFHADVHSG